MEEKQKVWIRGHKGRGSEIVKILEDLGATNKDEVGCEDESTIYFIDHQGRISCVRAGLEIKYIIMENYKEIELPRQAWNDGEVLVCDKNPRCFAIFKRYHEGDRFEAYFLIDDNGLLINTTASVECYHLASDKEYETVAKAFYAFAQKFYEASKKLER